MSDKLKPTPVEKYKFNKALQIEESEKGSNTNQLTLYLYSEIHLAVSISTRDADADYTVMDLTAEQARAIGTMLLYAAQQAENAENAKENTR